MDPIQGILQALATAYQDVTTIRCAELASSIVIIYDHLVTLDDEIELVWRAGWSLGKVLFLLNRYYALFAVIFNNFFIFSPRIDSHLCTVWIRWQGITGIISFILGELILQLRLYALYFLNKKVLAFMSVTFVGSVIASSTLMGISLSQTKVASNLIPNLPFCVPTFTPQIFYAFWIPMLVSETVLCGLALWRGIQTYSQDRTIFQSGKKMIEVLIRDSFLYFLIMFAVYLTNTVIFILGDPTKMESSIGFAVTFSCVLGSRLCLNVRSLVRDDDFLPTPSKHSRPGLPISSSTRRLHSLKDDDDDDERRSSPKLFPDAVPSYRSHVVVIGQGKAVQAPGLTEYEMHELRSMRADKV